MRNGRESSIIVEGSVASFLTAWVEAVLAQWLYFFPGKLAYAIYVVNAGVFEKLCEAGNDSSVPVALHMYNELVKLFHTLFGTIVAFLLSYVLTPTSKIYVVVGHK